jgi:hypothetical protein
LFYIKARCSTFDPVFNHNNICRIENWSTATPYFVAITNLQKLNKMNRSELKKLKFQLQKSRALVKDETRLLTAYLTLWRSGVAYRKILRIRFHRILSQTSAISKRTIFKAWIMHTEMSKAERQNHADFSLVEEEMDILKADLLASANREKEAT